MFIFRVYILYFTACKIVIDEFIKIVFSIQKYHTTLNSIITGLSKSLLHLLCFNLQFINDLKTQNIKFYFILCFDFLFLLNRFYYIAATIIIIAIIICLMMINHVNIFNMSSPVLHKIRKLEWDVNVRPS